MRRLWIGALGASLSLGTAGAWAQEPAATLGRPIPAASLGRPIPISGNSISTAGYQNDSPTAPAATIGRDASIPILAPITTPGNLSLADGAPASRPLPSPDAPPSPMPGGPGSAAVPAPPPTYGPGSSATPAPGASPAPSSAPCCGDPVIAPAQMALNPFQPFNGRFQSRFYTSAEYLLWFARN